MLLDQVRDLTPAFAARDEADPERYPSENVADLYAAGVPGAPFAAPLGGCDATLREAVGVVEEVAHASPSTALLLAMPLGLAGAYAGGPEVAPPEHRASWTNQTERVAADFRAGRVYAACNSEKGAGGALSATKTVAARGRDGEFRLTGDKILASFGRHADVFFSTARVAPAELPVAGDVEFFLLDAHGPGVEILDDWNGFGMRSTESHSVRLLDAPARERLGFPNFIATVMPSNYWACLFAAVPLGCARALLDGIGRPAPTTPALRLHVAEATMRYEAARAYLLDTADSWRPIPTPELAARVLRTKTFVSREAVRLCAELFALSGGRHYTRDGRLSRALAASFAGTALRPPLPLALDTLAESFTLDGVFE